MLFQRGRVSCGLRRGPPELPCLPRRVEPLRAARRAEAGRPATVQQTMPGSVKQSMAFAGDRPTRSDRVLSRTVERSGAVRKACFSADRVRKNDMITDSARCRLPISSVSRVSFSQRVSPCPEPAPPGPQRPTADIPRPGRSMSCADRRGRLRRRVRSP